MNPSDRHGQGGAHYTLTKSGKEVWSGDLPFTMIDAVVTDVGEVVGYCYSNGIKGFGNSEGYGDFRVVILDPAGKPRLNEATTRESKSPVFQAPRGISCNGFP